MKKKIFLALSMVMVLALAAVAFAYNQSTTANSAKMDCCKSKDSCPMKSADGKTESCCDDANCCCKTGDSCPMKKGEAAKADHEMKDMTHQAMAGEHKSCDCSCCKKSDKAVG